MKKISNKTLSILLGILILLIFIIAILTSVSLKEISSSTSESSKQTLTSENLDGQLRMTPGYDIYDMFGLGLTDAENELLRANKIRTYQMYKLSKKATEKTIEFFGKSGYQNNSDAFRHGYWNALMTIGHGVENAKLYADAHEDRPDTVQIDLDMDLANNQTGRDYGETYKSLSQDELALRILDCVLSGRFKRIVNNTLVETNYEGVVPQYGFNTTDLANNKIRVDSVNFTVIGNFKIPESIDGKEVTEIGNDAFRNQFLVSNIEIPRYVVRIGNYAFAGCTKLTAVTHNDYTTLTYLGTGAFMGSVLTLYRIPDNLVSISDWTFAECGVLVITYNGSTLTTIGDYAFYKTSLSANSNIPITIETIGDYAFYGSDFWSDFAFAPNNVITSIGEYAFANNPTLKSLVITDAVQYIGAHAFSGCTSLTIYTDQNSNNPYFNANWNSSNRPVLWSSDISHDNSYVISIDKSSSVNTNAVNGISNPIRKDYKFGGWYTFSNFSGTQYMDVAAAPNEILYAKWEEKACVAEGTLITLADGTQKAVENLTGDEQLLVWNFFTGRFDAAPILFIDHDASRQYEVIRLTFSDGTTVKVIDEHGFWDFDLNRYVYLRRDAAQYIGHWFQKQSVDENGNLIDKRVRLTDVAINIETTSAWSPVTYGHLSYYVNGILSIPGATTGLVNIFEVDSETMKFDETAFQADITEYGLFSYSEFSALYPVPETVFDAFGGQYLKVAMGKGYLNEQTLKSLIERYAKFF